MSIEHARKMALEYELPGALKGCLVELSRNALFAAMAAMDRGETDAAMNLLETGFKARLEDQSTLCGGSASNWSWMHPVHCTAAAIAGRSDLIRLAAATETKALEQVAEGLDQPAVILELDHPGITGVGLTPPAELIRQYQESAPSWADRIAEHRDRLLEALKLVDVYRDIRSIVAAEPGIRQTDLAGRLPEPFIKRTSTLVNQLEAAKMVVTGKDGSRVTVWPADYHDLPATLRVVSRPWTFTGSEDFDDPDELPALEGQALRVVGWARNLASVIRPAIEHPESPESIMVQDFAGYLMGTSQAEGHLCRMDDEWRELAILGHVPLEVPVSILSRHRDSGFSSVKARSMKRWLAAEPRHTYLVIVPGKIIGEWALRPTLTEVLDPCPGAIPVTVLENAADHTEKVKGMRKEMLWLWEAEKLAASVE
ncbi:hypothetical protein [Arthrobacter caoxuetaonis]|uniref:Uncharacterized protein n=1 Tax=Arthrobacter caoxuetaonis TaxID=2886935 RepID=A0A9X1MIC6_9MICC|nr:hypothetical protein [Arthrobacter caoxuetaonis]MCC3299745.1 hypothetical protein [Arthrobacter caoxuetaonis]USQ59353.1 hypothetical protein NF551_17375 [Arthrobacter caoxuetaonis]